MHRRQGATLVEVLVAIFVMGIGLIALLTLFPLGALRMQQAIQDDRCAAAVVNANAVATLKNIRNDSSVRSPTWYSTVDVFKDVPSGSGRSLPADPDGPSYPVFADPLGTQNSVSGTLGQKWLGTGGGNYNAQGLIARCPVSFATGTATYKWFSLLDDMTFSTLETTTGGTPISPLQRDIRYSWAYLLQRPRSSDPSIVNCAVVVFNKRPLSLSANLTLGEAAYKVGVNTANNTFTVDYRSATSPPNIRQGDWILDCTLVTNPLNAAYASAHGSFYRVVGISEKLMPASSPIPTSVIPVGTPVIDFEVQQPIRGTFVNSAGTIMVLDGIADVYERGLDRKFD